MFCKYCGKPLVGTKCSACGKETVLVQYSTELDKLMASKAPVGGKAIPEKTYQQGIEEGYQRGLSDGYKNGLKDGETKNPSTPVRTINKKLLTALCAVVFLIGAIASWMISSKTNYASGFAQGKKEGEDAAKAASATYYSEQLETRYWQGYADGESNGKAEMEALYSQLIPTEDPTTQAPTATQTPFPKQYEVICSRYVNNGSRLNPSPDVIDVQDKLKTLGYLSDKDVDGVFGPTTEKAVKAFQKENELPETGEVDRITYDLLFTNDNALVDNPSKTDILETTVPDINPTETPEANNTTIIPYTTENLTDNSPSPSPTEFTPFGFYPELAMPTSTPSAEDESIVLSI